MNTSQDNQFDYIIAGGGLQAALIVVALRHYQPTASVLLVEKGEKLCGNHTWSFHASDVPQSALSWVMDLPIMSWDSYSVEFPGFQRQVDLKYCSLVSADVHDFIKSLSAHPCRKERTKEGGPIQLLAGTVVASVESNSIKTEDGRIYNAKLVIDCRGLTRDEMAHDTECGFQKFHGFEVEVSRDWSNQNPVLMDARTSQADGFRFLYVLPLGDRRVLIEDTRFSDNPRLHRTDCLKSMQRYLQDRSVDRFEIVREEHGCLPMPYSKRMQPQLSRSVAWRLRRWLVPRGNRILLSVGSAIR